MKGATIDEGKEISPMFPRLHVKDAEKGGPKAPPRNKMALYEQFSIPSQSFASGQGSPSLFPLQLRNCSVPTTPSNVSQVDGCQSLGIQLCTSNAPSILSEKIQAYNSRKINLIKSTQDNFINSKNSLKPLDGEDAFITLGSAQVKSSFCGINQNDKDEEDKSDRCNLSFSLKSHNSFRKMVNSPGAIEMKSVQHGKNQMEEHTDVSQTGQEEEEDPPHSLNGFDDMKDLSSVKGRNSKPVKNEHRSLKEEIRNISKDSLKTLQGSNGHTDEDHGAFGDKINLKEHCMEKPAVSDVQKSSGELEIGRRCFLGKRGGNKDEESCRDYDVLSRPSSECGSGMDISPDDVVGVIGEKQFWKTRRTIINNLQMYMGEKARGIKRLKITEYSNDDRHYCFQQRIFLMQVFELHRLIKVQRLIAGSPHILLEDNLLLNKPPLKTSSPMKLSQSDFVSEQPSTVLKLDSKSEKTNTAEHVKNNVVEKIPLPCVSNISKGHINQLSNYPLGNLGLDKNSKQSPSIVFPPPPGNQWLVPVMSPSEGLVYKPIMAPCPPNAGIMTPLYGTNTCGTTMSFSPGSKDVVLDAALTPACPQKIGIISGSSLLPQFVPSSFIHRSTSAFSVEQVGQSNGPENHHSFGEANSAILYQSPSNMSSQISQVMSRNIPTYHHHTLEDKELQISTASSPSKRIKGDVLPLFPVAPTFWPSAVDRGNSHDEHQSKVIKALPHNPKTATESAARIFRSIQEERKLL